MKEELEPKKKEEIQKLLKAYQEFKIGREEPEIAKAKLEGFLSKIESMARERKPLEILKPKERFVFARPAPALAGALAALLVFALIYSYAFLPQAPVIHGVKGTVKVFDASKNEWAFAKESLKIRENDIVKTFKDGSIDITLGNTYSMRLKRNSEIKVAQLNSKVNKRAVRFEVAKGKIFAYYSPRAAKKGAGFELKTKEVLSSAVGTDFMLEALPKAHKTWLGVLNGIVRVTSLRVPKGLAPDEATVYVKSRYKTEVFEGGVPEKPERMMEKEWLDMKELYSIGKKPQVALLISTGSTRTRELLSIVPLYVSDKVSTTLANKFEKAAKTYERALEENSMEKHVDAVRQFENIVRQHPNPKYDVPFLLFTGAYYEYIENHDKAIATFREVTERYPKSSLSSIAQCAIGIIYEERLNQPAKAREAYQKVISQYPESPEAEEALSGLNRLTR